MGLARLHDKSISEVLSRKNTFREGLQGDVLRALPGAGRQLVGSLRPAAANDDCRHEAAHSQVGLLDFLMHTALVAVGPIVPFVASSRRTYSRKMSCVFS